MINLKQLSTGSFFALIFMGLSATAWAEESPGTWEKVLFHLDESANARWALMLARSYLDDNPAANLVFVTYGPGVDFLLDDAEDKRGNPYDHAVLSLVERGVDFRVCAATLSAREISEKAFLDAVSIVPSGISEIARLQLKEGYAYLKP